MKTLGVLLMLWASPGLAITSGAADAEDASAVLVIATVGTSMGYCSGVIVAPRVVLTAAHCVGVSNAHYSIFLGDDYRAPAQQANATNFVEVTERHAHPDYDARLNANDIGVLITAEAMTRPAVAINRRALDGSAVGQPARVVGFGETVAGDMSTLGRRTQGMTRISEVSSFDLTIAGIPNICLYDSGGPTYLAQDGGEVVGGLHYVIDSTSCDQHGYDVRVDLYTAFIDGYVSATSDAGAPEDAGADVDAGVTEVVGSSADAGDPPPPPSPRAGCSTGAPLPVGFAVLFLLGVRARTTRHRARARRPWHPHHLEG